MYQAYVTKLKNVRKHSNADRLMVGECFGSNVIVGLNTPEGTLGVYFPTDGRLSEAYANANNLVRKKDENGNNIGGYMESNRHVRAISLRKEQSDGLFMPLESLSTFTDIAKLKDGDTIDVLNGVLICEKYFPKTNPKGNGNGSQKKVKPKEKEKFLYFEQHADTSQLAYNLNDFKVGELCYITNKMHGTSARTANALMEKKRFNSNFMNKMFKPTRKWEVVSGTRRVTLKNYNGGYYGSNSFRQQYHDLFDGKLQKGEEVFYEIVGYTDNGGTIMGKCANKKTQDKAFIKKYGETTIFSYGCEEGQSDIFVYRMTMTNEDGVVVEYPWELVKMRCEQMNIKHCMEYDKFFFTTIEDLMERVEKYYDGADDVGKTHVREGSVVRIDSRPKFKAYKHKNYHFKVLEGIIKEDGIIDMEEMEELEGE